jgi:predicted RNA-binding Zn-ribbon protein involved in translation (DUF1610 family)
MLFVVSCLHIGNRAWRRFSRLQVDHATVTHNTPHDTADQRRWCANCELAVEPSVGDAGPECPACGDDL